MKLGNYILDTRAGSGYITITIARHGLNIKAINITPHYIADIRKNVKKYIAYITRLKSTIPTTTI